MGTLALARQALYDAAATARSGRPTRRPRAGRKRPRYDAALAAWQDVLAGPAAPGRHRQPRERHPARAGPGRRVQDQGGGGGRAPGLARSAALIKARKLPLLVERELRPAARPAAFFGAEDEEKEKREIEEAESNPAALHKAGVRFALVSGHAPDFLAGVRKAIEKGLPARRRAAGGHPGARRRCWAWPTAWAAWRRARSRTSWPGRAIRSAKDAKVEDGLRGRRALRARGEAGAQEGRRATACSPSRDSRREAGAMRTGRGLVRACALARGRGPAPPARRAGRPTSRVAIVGGTILTARPAGHDRERAPCSSATARSRPWAATSRCPPAPRVIDADGRYVMPGIIDAHSHTADRGQRQRVHATPSPPRCGSPT